MFYLQNFKNFASAELDCDKPVTIVVGPNGAGKSNLIEGVELLGFLASGKPLHEVTEIGREGGLEVRGGLDACARRGQEQFTLGFRGAVSVNDQLHEVDYQISVRVGKQPHIAAEYLRLAERDVPVFEVLPQPQGSISADNTVRYDNHARGRNKPTASVAGDRSALSQYARFAHGNKALQQALALVDGVSAALSPPAVFDPVPRLMRNYERSSETQLARNGFNISPVLANQKPPGPFAPTWDPETGGWRPSRRETSDQGAAARILKRIKQLPDEPFTSFEFIRTKAGDVILGFKLHGGGEPVTARLLSDGTLRALAVLTALETSPKGRRIVIEEFDNGVHPSRVQLLTESLFDCAERHGLRTLVTTHNPATLNALAPDQIGAVLLVVQDRETNGGRLIPLSELPGYIEFVEKGRLGDLITRRVYEKHLDANYEEDRKEDLSKWLENLP